MKVFIAVLFIVSQAAFAQDFDYSKKWGIGGSFGYGTPIFGNHFNTAADGGETWGFHVRYHLCKSCGLEAAFTKYEFDDTKAALQVTDLLFFKRLAPTARFTPVIGAGAGVVDISHYDPSSLKMGLKLRGGAEYAINEAFSLGLNLDYQHVNKMLFGDNLPGRNIHVLAGRVGLTWYFSGAGTGTTAIVATPAATNKAHDPDSDGDGIADSKDKCPNTARGVKVNAYGCAISEKASVNLNVQFESGKSIIASGYDSDLKELATFMAEHPQTKIEIQGHSDSSGNKTLNKNLSLARANAVRAYLINELSVDASRITANGYGDEQPIADNSTSAGRAKNRRVIAVIND